MTTQSQIDSRSGRLEGETDEQLLYKVGQGNWRAVAVLDYPMERVLEVAATWAEAVKGLDKAWLVWCVHPDWALLQQRLVEAVGWTPVVGGDPRAGRPPLSKTAIPMDFNAGLGLPVMYPHFVIDLVFAWADRLAFWHSDLLVREAKLRDYTARFERLADGECWATKPAWRRAILDPRKRRYWELLGCTTRGASRAHWETGTGWLSNFHMHPNCPDERERERRRYYNFDMGTGIWYWANKLGGKVHLISEKDIAEGHFTKIGNPNYKRSVPQNQSASNRNMFRELEDSFELTEAAGSLGLAHLLQDAG
jgi:hypothetical protein